jgi:hypothetical protein
VSILSACGGVPPAPSRAERSSWDGALTELVPPGASIVVVARPRELARAPASHRVIASIAPDDRLETYRQHTGIDPRELEELLFAETPDGTILVVRGPFRAPLAVAEMARRMLPLESSADEPWLRRGGHYHGARRDLIALSDHVLMAVTGSPALTESVLARTGADAGEGGLGGPDVGDLLRAHGSAPLVVVAPTPISLPPGSGVALLLARERALIATATPVDATGIRLDAELRGEFPPGADANFRALAEALAESDLGAAVGMRDALATLTVQSGDEQVVLRATLPATAMAAGLRVLFEAEIAELVEPQTAAAQDGADPRSAP